MVCKRTVKPRRSTYASNMSKTYHRQFDSRTVHVQSAAKDHTKYYSNIKKMDQSQSKLQHIIQENINRRRLTPYYKITDGNHTNNDDKKSEDTT